LTKEKPNHIYFSNRANAYLELSENQKCIDDCNESIKIDPNFHKSYFRKAKAQVNLDKLVDAIETLNEGLKIDKDREEMKDLLNDLVHELELENKLPVDHPERKRFQNLLDWLKDGGSEFDKLKLRFYSENYRGVHAARDIKERE
jgi:tetratricopeptide (TPR) repeat protein